MHGGDPWIIIGMMFVIFAVMRRRGFGPGLFQQRRLEQEIADLRAEQRASLAPRNTATQDQVQMLEDRVRVLERIVTDQNYSLARDIEALRDPVDRRQPEENI
jgi:hypothetical protein